MLSVIKVSIEQRTKRRATTRSSLAPMYLTCKQKIPVHRNNVAYDLSCGPLHKLTRDLEKKTLYISYCCFDVLELCFKWVNKVQDDKKVRSVLV